MDQYYNSISSGYENLYGKEQRNKIRFVFENKILDENEMSGISVLDVGCGSSVYKDMIKAKFYVGIDPSIGLLRKGNILSFLGFSEKLPFSDNSFDLVISLSAVQNFTDVDLSINEILRVCKMNGKIIISVGKRFDRVVPKIKAFLRIREEFSKLRDLEIFEQEKDLIFSMIKV